MWPPLSVRALAEGMPYDLYCSIDDTSALVRQELVSGKLVDMLEKVDIVLMLPALGWCKE